jgi:hypothetical protein
MLCSQSSHAACTAAACNTYRGCCTLLAHISICSAPHTSMLRPLCLFLFHQLSATGSTTVRVRHPLYAMRCIALMAYGSHLSFCRFTCVWCAELSHEHRPLEALAGTAVALGGQVAKRVRHALVQTRRLQHTYRVAAAAAAAAAAPAA